MQGNEAARYSVHAPGVYTWLFVGIVGSDQSVTVYSKRYSMRCAVGFWQTQKDHCETLLEKMDHWKGRAHIACILLHTSGKRIDMLKIEDYGSFDKPIPFLKSIID